MEDEFAMVIYRVVVYQECLFLSGDAHRTVVQLVGSRGASERVPLAERSICRVLKNMCCCSRTTEEEAEYAVYCPSSLGALLLVRLEAPPTTASVWFCSKVSVTTPEGGVSVFPCYRFVSCSTSLALRDSIAKFVFDDVRPIELDQRINELTYRRQAYRWSCYDDGLPETMKADDITSLPAEVRFSVSKATDMMLTVGKVLVELGLQSFLCSEQRWSSFHQIHQLCKQTRTPTCRLVERLWREDWFFGHQFLNGANPTLIRRCTEIPPNMAVTEETVRASLEGGASLSQEMERGNMFVADYRLLDGLTANTVNRKQNYLTAPLVLLHLNSTNQLLPVAIQLKQSPGETNPVFVPQDLEADWLTAKTFVRSADFADHELRSHFLRTHVMSELFAMATLRNFPMVHPLYKLLGPHFRFTLEIDTLARQLLLSDGGSLKEYTAVGGAATLDFLRRASASLTYRDLCLPDDITGRGLDSIPGYYYRDDGLRLWDIIHRYVGGVVSYYYRSNNDVTRDSELQSWINEIVVFGRLGDEKKGFPKSFSSVPELTYFVTMVIFNASAQHTAVNNAQLDYFGWMPNAPVGLQRPPPACRGRCSERSLLDSFPDVNSTVHGLATVYLLSKKPADFGPGLIALSYYVQLLLSSLFSWRQQNKVISIKQRLHLYIEEGEARSSTLIQLFVWAAQLSSSSQRAFPWRWRPISVAT
ncbi:polyunsaturated fatty acid lipoxygenase ALOX15B-like isoform X3 [Siniperca chuatsi]|uniref:polyunsaturated fatty acid lipoxygenase ALOX15B-like isoform X3 n=1 Tax=Siniperca chuatsi TaxID=119488 RepID=UPI001CE077CA|nr:polyunsaturated fatty acid lipoxygenase ALOX15B-like isoform X3 [Siniperca chuatsi]